MNSKIETAGILLSSAKMDRSKLKKDNSKNILETIKYNISIPNSKIITKERR